MGSFTVLRLVANCVLLYTFSISFHTCVQIFRLKAGFNCKCFVVADFPGDQQHRCNNLEIVVAGQCDEQMQEQSLAVFKNLWPVVI